jgi:hypothetical protein
VPIPYSYSYTLPLFIQLYYSIQLSDYLLFYLLHYISCTLMTPNHPSI